MKSFRLKFVGRLREMTQIWHGLTTRDVGKYLDDVISISSLPYGATVLHGHAPQQSRRCR